MQFYALYREIPGHPQGGWWVVVNRRNQEVTNDGPFAGPKPSEYDSVPPEVQAAVDRRNGVDKREVELPPFTHELGVCRIWRVGGEAGSGEPPTFRAAGIDVRGKRVRVSEYTTLEALCAYIGDYDRARPVKGLRILRPMGSGPRKRWRSLEEFQLRQRARKAGL